jgi:carbon monoxide dehydrogenase subunit G
MNIDIEVTINSSKEKVWNVITDIENSVNVISGIEKIDILEKPDQELSGLKWKETRTIFGKTATEVMWITDVKDNESYMTRAESHGQIYITKLSVSEKNGQTRLSMSFNSEPQSFGAKLMSGIMSLFFKGATKKALEKDLNDIKATLEKS